MCHNFSRAGYRIELVKELSGVPTPDVLINGVKGERKSVASYKQIERRARDARKQGADVVLFEFDNFTSEHIGRLEKLKRQGYKVLFYVIGENKIRTP